ncbi:MAG: DNA-protecting protein DprA [Rubrivivax sp.]|nr:DNA-protecting protein DprA [Rubrivivax sp.]
MAADSEFEAWFRLLETPGLGAAQARQLLAAFSSPDAVLRALPSSLRAFVPGALASAIAGPVPETFGERLRRCQAWFGGGASRRYLTLGDPEYPPRLLQTADPPALLYAEGAPALLAQRSLAIVGSRHPTPQGEQNARAFAAALGRAGYGVVSGLARGIDAAAHEGALMANAGTVAVLGAGPDLPYPAQNAALAARIVDNGGLMLSEYAPGTPAVAANFPRRNRIIAGLSLGTLVVEAALRSGSLITARLASEAGREVFAIPGSIHATQSKGCHALIKQGAKLVETAADILEEIESVAGRSDAALKASTGNDTFTGEDDGGSPPADPVLRALGHDPATLDALLARTGWPAADLAAKLLELELEGRIARMPGGLYLRVVRG